MTNVLLYVLTVLFWGTSLLGISSSWALWRPRFPFFTAWPARRPILIAYCVLARRPMRLFAPRPRLHGRAGLVPVFPANYVLVYLGSQYLTSGLAAVAFSSIVVMNIVGAALLFAAPIRARVVVGAVAGIAGLAVVFWPEIRAFDVARDGAVGLALVLAGTGPGLARHADLGAQPKARPAGGAHGLPVVQTNAFRHGQRRPWS